MGKLPSNTGAFISLEKLRLHASNIEEIPVSLQDLSKLSELSIHGCMRLKSLPELLLSLELLDASECISLEVSNSRDALIHELSGNHVIAYRRFLYDSCLNLDQSSRNNILSEFQLRALDTRIKSLLTHSILKKSYCTPGVGICCPGNEIPLWFTYWSKSSSIKVELSSDWQNANFLGFALCTVVEKHTDFFFNLSCEGNFKTKYGKCYMVRWDFNHVHERVLFKSSNMFMRYKHGNYHDYLDAVEVSFNFSNEKVKACGIRLLYRQDAEEHGIHQ